MFNNFTNKSIIFQRFNVALTRAKSLLIVIGNGHLLQLDPYFYAFIKFCQDRNGLFGPKLDIGEPPAPHAEMNLFKINGKFNCQSYYKFCNHLLLFTDESTEVDDDINFSRLNI